MKVRKRQSRKRTATPEESARLLAPLRSYADVGGNVNELARLAQLPPQTLHDWLTRGVPMAVVDFDRVMRCLPRAKRRINGA